VYCYAGRGIKLDTYDPGSPLLCDSCNGTEKITSVEMKPVFSLPKRREIV
jgi:hypothetical protein